MLNLIRKDFIAGWMFVGIATLMIPFLTSLAIWAMMDDFGGIALGFITILTVLMCTASSLIFILVDTVSKTESTYAGLPLERTTIVLSRYAGSLILITYSLCLAVFTIWLLSFGSGGSDRAFAILLSLRGITGMYVFLILINSFLYPFILKYGTGRGAFIYFSAVIVLGLLDPLVGFLQNVLSGIILIDLSFIKNVFESTVGFIRFLPLTELYLLLFSVLISIISTSLLLSIKFYSKRDL